MSKKNQQLQLLIAREAARLMFEEGVEQYFDVKRKAAKRVVGKNSVPLPSNGQISDELYQLSKLTQGEAHGQMLFEMRLLALDVMEHLVQFTPRLIGSVSTGRIRQGSDIDLHVFSDHLELILLALDELGWSYETKEVWVQPNGKPKCYNHVYLDFEFPVELSVYEVNEIRIAGRSSTDGKLIDRVSVSRLRDLLMDEHAEAWEAHTAGMQ